MLEWTETPSRYGQTIYRRSDGSEVRPTITAGGNVKWEARHGRRGLAASPRGYATKFSSANVARKWVEKHD